MKKNKGLVAVVLTLLIVTIIAILIFPKVKDGYMGKTIDVVTLNSDISARTLISESMVKVTSMPAEFIDEKRVISNKEEVIGKYSTVDILTTDFLTKEKITNENNQALYEPKRLIAITMPTLAASVGGVLNEGDFVSIYGYKEGFENNTKLVYDDLKNIEVAYVLNNQGVPTKEAVDSGMSVPAVVVLKVDTDQQIQELLNLEFETKIHLERVG